MHNHFRVRKEATRLARHVSHQVCRVQGLNHVYTHHSILQHFTVANEWLLRVAVDEWSSIGAIHVELPRLLFPIAFVAIGDGMISALWDRLVDAIALEAGKPVPVTMDQADEATRHELLPAVGQSEWLSICKQTPYFSFRHRLMGQDMLEALPVGTSAAGDRIPGHLEHQDFLFDMGT
jgi:hypothetical protein